ncbi:hypothetical protein CV770_06895 [Bradyrhizobium sp. AC87j1]|nr:hypothetical protein CV770_06895 [Bradyrhizobium sp. AC87j1]
MRKSLRRHCEEPLRRSNPDCLGGGILDCFAEPVIGPRLARTRWLAMTGIWQCLEHTPTAADTDTPATAAQPNEPHRPFPR